MNESILLTDIKNLQEQLIHLFTNKGSLTDREVISKSEELDKIIIEYLKLTTKRSK